MSKNISGGMTTHLSGPGTTLAICWRVERRDDGRVFGFTGHDQDIDFEGVTYVARSGFRRTAISNSSGLAVDNLDVTGILNDSEITPEDIRNGRYDRAKVRVFAVNYTDLTQGDIKLRAGQFGEIKMTQVGTFVTELRGMVQRLQHNFMPQFQPTCRNDLGDSNCTVPINPPLVLRSTAYAVGDYVRASNALVGFPFTFPMDDDTGDEVLGRLPVVTQGGQVQFNRSKMKFGNGAVEFLPSGSVNPSDAFLFYSDDARIELGASDFTIELWVRFNSLTDGNQTFASKYTNSGNQRSWRLGLLNGQLFFRASSDGINEDLELLAEYAPAFDINVWYHVAVERSGDAWTLYLGGDPQDTLTTAFTVFNATSELRFGKLRSVGGDDNPLHGLIDDVRITVGEAYYTDNYLIDIYGSFEPPTEAHPAPGLTQDDFANRIYECTTAGTTASVQPTFDTDVSDTTTDGSVVFTAREAFMRHAVVDTVVDNRQFSLTITEPRAVDDWFNGGVLEFEEGDNQFRRIEIKDWDQSSAEVILWEAAFYTVTPGTKVRLYPGCNKTRDHCKNKFVIPSSTNFSNGNMANFDGEPDVPGEDFFLSTGAG